MLNLFYFALHTQLRYWRRNLIFLIVYSLIVAFYASMILFLHSMRYEAGIVLSEIPEMWVQKTAGGRLIPMPLSLADSLAGIRGVEKVFPRIWGYLYDAPTGAVFTVVGTDLPQQELNVPGIGFQSKQWSDSTALCGRGFLELRGLETGDYLTLSDAGEQLLSFRIVGAFQPAADLISRDLIVLSGKAARQVLGYGADQCTDLAIKVPNLNEIDNIGRKIDRKFAGLRVVNARQLRNTYQALLGWKGALFLYGFVFSLLAFLLLAWHKASGLSDQEKKEIGLLKAVGWQISDILKIKFFESFTLSFTATLLGFLLAYLHIFIWDAEGIKALFAGWSVLYPAYRLQPVLDIEVLIQVFALSVLPYLAATLVPAWKAAVIDPAEVMQD